MIRPYAYLAAVSLASCCVAAAAAADSGGILSRFHVGPEAGVFLPSSERAADRFGDTWLSVGVGFGALNDTSSGGKISPDFDLFLQTHGDNHAFFMPIGVEYRRTLGQSGRLVPFAGGSIDAVITDIRSDQDNISSRYRMAYGSSLFAGLDYGRHGFLEARYYLMTHVRSIDLSGLDIKAGYRF